MFALLLSLLFFVASPTESDTIKVTTEIDGVTVFQNQAQIHRSKKVDLKAGTTTLVFGGLSEFLNSESIQLKGNGRYTLLSLTTRNNFTEEQIWREDVQELRNKRNEFQKNVQNKRAELEVISREETMLHSTQEIIKNNKMSSTEITSLLDLYSFKLTELITQRNRLDEEVRSLNEEIDKLNRQIGESGQIKRSRFVEVVAEVQSESAISIDFDLSYLVYNAGWTPSYDIRSADISSPMEITYKANIYQNTGIDWKDVKFVINSGDPSSSAIKPELNPFRLGWANQNFGRSSRASSNISIVSNAETGIVRGRVIDGETGESLPGANVSISETNQGAVTNANGTFELPILSNGRYSLRFDFIGFKSITVPITISNSGYYLAIPMEQEMILGEEIVVAAISNQPGVSRRKGLFDLDGPMDLPPPLEEPVIIQNQVISNQTSFSYEIGIPYSVPSDGKEHTVEIKQETIKADYNFSTVPKLSNYAYLVGNIPDWSSLNLIDGNANIYFDNSFVGTTFLSPEAFEDTLAISLGKDERIVIERKKRNEYSKKNFFRNKVREMYSYEINIRNTKSEAISITVEDQLPLSTNDDIKVNRMNLSDGKVNEDTGLISWDLTIEPGKTKTLLLEFEIEYPKGRRINY